MATERIEIIIREDGSRVVNRNLDDIGKKSEGAASKLGVLKTALAGVVTGVIANQIRQLTSQWTDLNSRIAIATGTQGQANAVMQRLQEIAKRTYSDLNITSEAYLRNAASLTEMGFSTKQQIDFTEALANALVVSGAKAERAESVTNALSKAIASGALRGENLNTVLESGGRVAEALAQGLGVGVNELRSLGAQGKLTSDVILPALNSQLEKLREEADSMPATINDALTNLRTQLMVTVGSFFDATGGSEALVKGIDWVRTTIEELTPEILNFGRALTGTLDPMDELSYAGKVFATIFVTVYGTLKAVGQLLVGSVLLAFKTAGRVIAGVVGAVVAVLKGEFSQAYEIVKEAGSDIKTTWVNDSNDIANAAIDTTSDMFMKLDQIWNKGSRDVQDRSSEIVEALNDDRGPIKVPGPSPADLAKQARELEKVRSALTGVLNQIAPLEGATLEMEKAQRTLNLAREKGLITQEQESRYLELLEKHYVDILDPLGKYTREIDQQMSLLRMTADQREIESQVLAATQDLLEKGVILTEQETAALREKFVALQQLNEVTQVQDQLLANSVEKRAAFITQLQAISALMKDPASGFTAGDAGTEVSGIVKGMGLDPTQLRANNDMIVQQFTLMYEQIDLLRQQDLISEQEASALRVQVWAQQQAQQLQTASSFFGQLSQLQQLEGTKAARLGKAAAIAQAIIKTYESATSAYASMAGIPYVGPALGAAAAAAAVAAGMANVQQIRSQPVGFATGGSFTVPGSGGVDSSMVAFRATPGERIAVQTPAQVRKGNQNGEQNEPDSPQVNQRIINIVDPAMVGDFLATQEGEQVLVNTLRRNSDILRSIAGQG